MVECKLPKLDVVGSSPIARFSNYRGLGSQLRAPSKARREGWQVSEELTKLAWEKKSHRPAFQIMEDLKPTPNAEQSEKERWQVSEELTKLAWEKKVPSPAFEFMKHLSGKMPDLLTIMVG